MEERLPIHEQVRKTLLSSGVQYKTVIEERFNGREKNYLELWSFYAYPREGDNSGKLFEASEKLGQIDGLNQLAPGVWHSVEFDPPKKTYSVTNVREFVDSREAEKLALEHDGTIPRRLRFDHGREEDTTVL